MLCGPLHSTLGAVFRQRPERGGRKRSVSSQRAIGDHAAKRGVTIGLEALNRFECYLFNTMDDLAPISTKSAIRISGHVRHVSCNIEEADPSAPSSAI